MDERHPGDPFADMEQKASIDEALHKAEMELQRQGAKDAGRVLAEFVMTLVPQLGSVSSMVNDMRAPGYTKARVERAEAKAKQ